jgi:hypothetical protein
VFQALKAFFNALDFGFQEIMQIIEALIHGIAKVVQARCHRIAEVVNAMIQMRDAAALKINPEQVSADYVRNGPPLVDNWIHCFSGY